VASLVEVGLAGFEGLRVPVGEPGATGYRVAKAMGKPTANTYKASPPSRRRALFSSTTAPRACAVPCRGKTLLA
jgi:hypothetical protein